MMITYSIQCYIIRKFSPSTLKFTRAGVSSTPSASSSRYPISGPSPHCHTYLINRHNVHNPNLVGCRQYGGSHCGRSTVRCSAVLFHYAYSPDIDSLKHHQPCWPRGYTNCRLTLFGSTLLLTLPFRWFEKGPVAFI